jgi:hypothetical protein
MSHVAERGIKIFKYNRFSIFDNKIASLIPLQVKFCNFSNVSLFSTSSNNFINFCERSCSKPLSVSNVIINYYQRRLQLAKNISKPFIPINKAYEVNGMCTFYKTKSKLLWIVYLLKKTQNVLRILP